jgi:p-cumate 2,3-dioxygenase beta subunit
VNSELLANVAEVEAFLYHEAELLDDWRLDEWLALFTTDCHYVVPSTDRPSGSPDEDVVLIDDDWERLSARVQRLKSRFAHREYPWSRTRHLITNIRIAATAPEALTVTANFVVYRFRGSVSTYVGRYRYHLICTDEGFRIRHRKAVLDNERLDEHGAVSILV